MLNAIKDVKVEIDNACLKPLASLSDEISALLSPSDAENCKTVGQMLLKQSQSIDKMHELNSDKLTSVFHQWQYFLNQIQEIYQLVCSLKTDVDSMVDEGTDDSLEVS